MGPPALRLGSAPLVQRLEVRWPSGRVSVMTEVPANYYLTVREAEAPARHGATRDRLPDGDVMAADGDLAS